MVLGSTRLSALQRIALHLYLLAVNTLDPVGGRDIASTGVGTIAVECEGQIHFLATELLCYIYTVHLSFM